MLLSYLVSPRSKSQYNTESVDDYLKAILELGGVEEERVTSNSLAQHLGVRAASVTGMLQKLAAQQPPFVKYEKHHGARLTAAGKMRALEVLERVGTPEARAILARISKGAEEAELTRDAKAALERLGARSGK